MHTESLAPWHHDHTFGQDIAPPGERRARVVVAITAAMMGVEVSAGLAFGSMALLADGLHMASHTVALGIAAAAYAYTRRRAQDRRFSFGAGKVNALAGYTSAVLLAVFALLMVSESTRRLFAPIAIDFGQAIAVAALGLVVNGACMLVLRGGDPRPHHHGDAHRPSHAETGAKDGVRGDPVRGRDHNLRAAYLHVLADALTSVLAVLALLAGAYLGAQWMDPAMGLLGAVLVGRWSWGLIGETGHVLLDRRAPAGVEAAVRDAIEADGDARLADLHVWSIGPGIYAAALSVVAHAPQSAAHYRKVIPKATGVVHATVEVHGCPPRAGV